MLVLGRKQNERLIIDGRIVVTVVRVSGGNVRLGIQAPDDVSIQREEIAQSQVQSGRGCLLAGRSA
jgi:carbon storage regulator